jgi:pyruvate/2-oxoglutarate dehydrogenase complex dihydrolipoamide acyltransferase (E2) component
MMWLMASAYARIGVHIRVAHKVVSSTVHVQVSVNDFIVRAVALALKDVPSANTQWDEASQQIVPCQGIDISIAVATDKGLITPIIKDADMKSLTQISAEVLFCGVAQCLMLCFTCTRVSA